MRSYYRGKGYSTLEALAKMFDYKTNVKGLISKVHSTAVVMSNHES